MLIDKIKAHFLTPTKAQLLEIELSRTPMTMTNEQSLSLFRNMVNQKHPPQMGAAQNRVRRNIGVPISASTVQRLTNDERCTDKTRRRMDEFEDKIKAVFEAQSTDITNQLRDVETSKINVKTATNNAPLDDMTQHVTRPPSLSILSCTRPKKSIKTK
jgi:hypothetical protein